MKTVLNYLSAEHSGIENIHIFSDGCTGQFKNKYTMASLLWYSEEFELNPKWYFFPTSHGKGAVDGIGATVKRADWNHVKSRQTSIMSAEDFANCVGTLPNVKVLFIPKKDVDNSRALIQEKWRGVRCIKNMYVQITFLKSQTKNVYM